MLLLLLATLFDCQLVSHVHGIPSFHGGHHVFGHHPGHVMPIPPPFHGSVAPPLYDPGFEAVQRERLAHDLHMDRKIRRRMRPSRPSARHMEAKYFDRLDRLQDPISNDLTSSRRDSRRTGGYESRRGLEHDLGQMERRADYIDSQIYRRREVYDSRYDRQADRRSDFVERQADRRDYLARRDRFPADEFDSRGSSTGTFRGMSSRTRDRLRDSSSHNMIMRDGQDSRLLDQPRRDSFMRDGQDSRLLDQPRRGRIMRDGQDSILRDKVRRDRFMRDGKDSVRNNPSRDRIMDNSQDVLRDGTSLDRSTRGTLRKQSVVVRSRDPADSVLLSRHQEVRMRDRSVDIDAGIRGDPYIKEPRLRETVDTRAINRISAQDTPVNSGSVDRTRPGMIGTVIDMTDLTNSAGPAYTVTQMSDSQINNIEIPEPVILPISQPDISTGSVDLTAIAPPGTPGILDSAPAQINADIVDPLSIQSNKVIDSTSRSSSTFTDSTIADFAFSPDLPSELSQSRAGLGGTMVDLTNIQAPHLRSELGTFHAADINPSQGETPIIPKTKSVIDPPVNPKNIDFNIQPEPVASNTEPGSPTNIDFNIQPEPIASNTKQLVDPSSGSTNTYFNIQPEPIATNTKPIMDPSIAPTNIDFNVQLEPIATNTKPIIEPTIAPTNIDFNIQPEPIATNTKPIMDPLIGQTNIDFNVQPEPDMNVASTILESEPVNSNSKPVAGSLIKPEVIVQPEPHVDVTSGSSVSVGSVPKLVFEPLFQRDLQFDAPVSDSLIPGSANTATLDVSLDAPGPNVHMSRGGKPVTDTGTIKEVKDANVVDHSSHGTGLSSSSVGSSSSLPASMLADILGNKPMAVYTDTGSTHDSHAESNIGQTAVDINTKHGVLTGTHLSDIGTYVDVLTLDAKRYAQLENAIQSGQTLNADMLSKIIGNSNANIVAANAQLSGIIGSKGAEVYILDGSHLDRLAEAAEQSQNAASEGAAHTYIDRTPPASSSLLSRRRKIPPLARAGKVIRAPHDVHQDHSPVGTVGKADGSIQIGNNNEMIAGLFGNPTNVDFQNVPSSVTNIPAAIGKRLLAGETEGGAHSEHLASQIASESTGAHSSHP